MVDAKNIYNEFSITNTYKHMNYLIDEVGERLSGSKEIEKAAKYISKQLEKVSVTNYIDSFDMYHSNPGEAKLKIYLPEETSIDAEPICHIKSTEKEGLHGELIYVKQGSYEDYQNIDPTNKIILTEMTWSPGRPEKARIAWEKGAKALIIMNWGPIENNPVIQMGGVKSQWGNPTPDSFKEIPQIPVLSISRKSGEFLKDILSKKGEIESWVKADATREWVKAWQPMAVVEAEEKTDEYILVGGHIDAWGKTAICNSSGNAICIELARVFQKHRNSLKRNIVFAFWDGHEIAECAGSSWYVDNNWSKLKNNCIAYINIDNIAIKGTTVMGIESVTEMKKIINNIIKSTWNGDSVWTEAHKGGGDSSFFGVGVPYIHCATEYTEEKLKELNYAFYSPWLHSKEDTIDKIDKELYKKQVNLFINLIYKLSVTKVVEYDINSLVEQLYTNLKTLESLCVKNNKNNLANYIKLLIEKVNIAHQEIELFTNSIEIENLDKLEIKKINNGYKKILFELSPIVRTYHGRYGQDPCCSVLAEMPVPLIYEILIDLVNQEEDSLDYRLKYTEYLKRVNMVSDGIENVQEIISSLKHINKNE